MVDITLTDNFQYQSVLAHANYEWPNIFVDQGQFSGPDFIRGTQRENVQLADNMLFFFYYLFYYTETTRRCLKFDCCRQQNMF